MSGQTYNIGVVINAKGASVAVSDLGKVDSKLNSLGQTAKAAFASFSGNISADAFQKITSLALDGGKALFDYNEKLQATKIGLESLTGSQIKANVLFKEIQQFSKETPFGALDLTKMAQRLVGANVELKKVVPLMRDVGNIVAATGEASQERLEGITVALTQVISKQKLSAEEAEQFAERGVNAYEIIAQATGKTQTEIRKLGEQGGLSADLFVRSLQKISKEKYGDAMARQSQLASVSITKIKDELIKAGSTALQPFFKEFGQISAKLRREIEAQKGDLSKIGEVLVKYLGEGVGKVTGTFAQYYGKQIADSFKRVFTEGKLFNKIGEAIMVDFWDGMLRSFGVNQEKIQKFRDRMQYALTFRILTGETFDEFQKNKLPDSSNYTVPKTYNYDRGPVNGQQSEPIKIDPTKELLEKQRKEREEAMKKQLADLEKYNKLKIEAEQNSFKTFQDSADRLFEGGKLDLGQYIAQSWNLVENYAANVRSLMAEGFRTATAGKKGQELQNEQLAYKNALDKFETDIEARKVELYKLQNEKQKEATEESIKITEQGFDRQLELAKASAQTRLAQLELDLDRGLVTETQYAESVGKIQIQTLEDEKARNQEYLKTLDAKADKYAEVAQRIKLLDEQLSQQQIANAKAVEKAVLAAVTARGKLVQRNSGEDGATAAPGPASGGWLDEWLGLGKIQSQTDIYQGVLTNLKDMTTDAFGAMGSAVGEAVGAWVLYGDSVGASLKKATASVLANLAQQATVKAVWELAEGFASLAVHDYPGAAKHFTASAIYGTVAGVAAIAGRAVAGDSFSQGDGRASNSNQPDYYTSNPNTPVQTSTNRNGEYTAVFQGLRDEIAALHNKIGSQRPGDILTAGAKERPGFIGQQTVSDFKRNGSLATDAGKSLRLT